MSRKSFTKEQQQILRQNPYVYSVTATRMQLTKEFKELFLAAYNAGDSPREILVNYGFDISILGERRIWSISYHIRDEYEKYGEFHEGYGRRIASDPQTTKCTQPVSEKDEIKQLRSEVNYLKQEMEFLKKISSIKTTRK